MLMAERWGREAVRTAITIGRDVNPRVLQRFIGDEGMQPLQAHNAEMLVQHIRWASRLGVASASQLVDPEQRRLADAQSTIDSKPADEW